MGVSYGTAQRELARAGMPIRPRGAPRGDRLVLRYEALEQPARSPLAFPDLMPSDRRRLAARVRARRRAAGLSHEALCARPAWRWPPSPGWNEA